MEYKCITSKTHRYINVRKFPSNYTLKKFHERDTKAIKKFNEHTRIHQAFFEELVKFITGTSYNNYVKKYAFRPSDCIKEEIHEMTGILIAAAGNYDTYCIPKTEENDKIYDFILENCTVPCKILKKTVGTYMDRGVSTHYRDNFKTPEDMEYIYHPRKHKLKKIFNNG